MKEKRYARDIIEESGFNGVKGKYFTTKDFNKFIKPMEMTKVLGIWKFVIYNSNENPVKREEQTLRESCLIDRKYFEIPEPQLQFNPVTLRLKESKLYEYDGVEPYIGENNS